MIQYLLPALVNGGAVFVGLLALWSLFGRMRETPPAFRARAAAFAGAVSAVITLLVTALVAGSA